MTHKCGPYFIWTPMILLDHRDTFLLVRSHAEFDLFTEKSHKTLGGRVSRAKQFMTFSVSVKPTKRNKKFFLHIDLAYSFTKTIKCIFIHCLLLYSQTFSSKRKRVEQIDIYIFNRVPV